jgi:uronate dehydrogenase
MPKILLTGAAGRLGRHLRQRLAEDGRDVLATDIVQPDGAAPVEIADLADRGALERLMSNGVDAVVHMGGIATEAPWKNILSANIEGTYNLFEAARRTGVRRIIYASSYHVVGMYPVAEVPLGIDAPVRPDTLYAVGKLFGENLARLYHDKFGIECLVMRICAASQPGTARELHLWCHPDDLTGLVRTGLDAPVVGYRRVFALSRCPEPWYVNDPVEALGWVPTHDVSALTPPDGINWPPADPINTLQGAAFTRWPHFDD